MEFDYSKLRGRIVERFGSCVNFCNVANISRSALSARLKNQIPFRSEEIYKFSSPELLDIPGNEIVDYFFTPLVR